MNQIKTRRWMGMALFVSLGLGGCQSKTLLVQSDPPGAEIFVTRMQGNTKAQPASAGVTPATLNLMFDKDVSYQVEARKVQYRTATAQVNWEPKEQTTLQLHLQQYLKTVPWTSFQLRRSGEGQTPRLVPVRTEAQGYVDVSEPCRNARNCRVLEMHNTQLADLTWVMAGKTNENVVVFQVVRSYKPEEFDTPTEDKETLRQVADRHYLDLRELHEMNNIPASVELATRGVPLKVGEASAVTQVFYRDAEGAGETLVTRGENTDLFPSFTWVDGEIILTSTQSNKGRLSLHRVMYKTPGLDMFRVGIAESQTQDYAPSASRGSPDSYFYFTSLVPGTPVPMISRMRPNGSELSHRIDNGEMPQVSRDDGDVVFLRRATLQNENRQIWRMSGNGSNLMPLTTNTNYDISSASWSPSGRWIVFASNEAPNADGMRNYSLWLMDRDGKHVTRLTENGSWDDCPSFNGGESEVFFRSNRGGAWRIWRLTPVFPAD